MRTFYVNYRLKLEVTVQIEAASIENAIIKGRELEAKAPQIVDLIDDYNDHKAELTGAYEV